jgi:hypothetical protein
MHAECILTRMCLLNSENETRVYVHKDIEFLFGLLGFEHFCTQSTFSRYVCICNCICVHAICGLGGKY